MKRFLQKHSWLLLALAAALLIGGGVGSARAALVAQSNLYTAQIDTSSLSVCLMEKANSGESAGTYVQRTGNDLLTAMLPEGEEIKPGQTYDESLAVFNNGGYEEYVRVVVKKSWKNADGTKNQTLDPALIDLTYLIGEDWIIDENLSTDERTVLYYTHVLPAGESVVPFTGTLTVSTETSGAVEYLDENGNTVDPDSVSGNITTSYLYNGELVCIEAEVDAVQTHNAADAMYGAWGVRLNVSEDGTVSLPDGQ